jgi:hypothetical protein
MFGLPKFAIYGAIALAVVLALAGLYKAIDSAAYERGQHELAVAVEKRNVEAGRVARERINEAAKCNDAGRTWDQSRGVCLSE